MTLRQKRMTFLQIQMLSRSKMEGILFEVLRYVTMVINMVQVCRRYFNQPRQAVLEYYLSFDNIQFDPTDEIVPSGCIYVCEYLDTDRHIRAIVQYQGERIRGFTPQKNGKAPWLWVGDITSEEVDITEQLNKFVVPGNRITHDLIYHVSGIGHAQYMKRESLEIVDFHEEGIVIEEDDSL